MAFQHNAFQHNAFQVGAAAGAAADPFRYVDEPRRSFRERLYDTTASANLALGIPVLVPRQPIFQVRPKFPLRPHSEDVVSSIALTATPAADPFEFTEQTPPRRQIAPPHSETTRSLALDEGALIPFRTVEQGKLPRLATPERSETTRSLAIDVVEVVPFEFADQPRLPRVQALAHSEAVRSLALDEGALIPFSVQETPRRAQVPLRPHSEIIVSLALTEVPAADPFRSDDASGGRKTVGLRAARSELIFNSLLFEPETPVTPPIKGGYDEGDKRRPKRVVLPDGRIVTPKTFAEYQKLVGMVLADRRPDLVEVIQKPVAKRKSSRSIGQTETIYDVNAGVLSRLSIITGPDGTLVLDDIWPVLDVDLMAVAADMDAIVAILMLADT